jgi:leucyl aminopeptidase
MKTKIVTKSTKSDFAIFLLTGTSDLNGFKTLEETVKKEILKGIKVDGWKFEEGKTKLFSFYDKEIKQGVVASLGKPKELTYEKIRKITASAIKKGVDFKPAKVSIFIPEIKGFDSGETVKSAVEGAVLASYLFDRHKTKKGDKISELFINTQSNTKKITEAVKEGTILAECTNIARDLVNEPSNVIYPETLAKEAVKLSKKYGFSAEIFEEKEIEKLKMESFLAVARAAEKRPRLIVLKYKGDPSSKEVTALVGKGLTYDTGGLALKPATGMVTMKCDMGGSAAVIGAISAIAAMKLKVNVISVVAACENSIGGNAYRNGDIIGSMAGKTIEVLNTDAEGRLTLIDAVTYSIRKLKATKIVDIATLTGAVMVALGNSVTGVVSNNDKFFKQLEKASENSGEQVWRLPNYPEYSEMLKSEIADLRNIGKNRLAGTITAGLFVGEFVENKPWLHLDIAGTAWRDAPESYNHTGGTGAGVRLLYHLMKNH